MLGEFLVKEKITKEAVNQPINDDLEAVFNELKLRGNQMFNNGTGERKDVTMIKRLISSL